MDLTKIPAFDAHCHPFRLGPSAITPLDLQQVLSGSPHGGERSDKETVLLVRMALRAMADLFGCDASWDAVIEARNASVVANPNDYVELLWRDTNIAVQLIDPGYPGEPFISQQEFAGTVPCPVYDGYRIERFFAADSFHDPEYAGLPDLVDAFVARLDDEAAKPETRFFKSVIAYITGLAIRPVTEAEALAAWDEHERYGDAADKVLRDYLFGITALKAAEHDVPFQVHTGHTANVQPWPGVNPMLMSPFLNMPEMIPTRFVLLHNGYPYCAEAGYLTAIFPNLMVDLSLMIPWASIGIANRIWQTLENAPTSKVMYGSDGIEMPELHWISAKIGRRALGQVLEDLKKIDAVGDDEAREIAEAIFYRNAERCYGIRLD